MKAIKIFNKDNKPMSRVWESERPEKSFNYHNIKAVMDNWEKEYDEALEAWEQSGKDYPVSEEVITKTTVWEHGKDVHYGYWLPLSDISKLQIKDGFLCLKEEEDLWPNDKTIEEEVYEENAPTNPELQQTIWKYAFDDDQAEAFITGAKWLRDYCKQNNLKLVRDSIINSKETH